MTEHECTWTSGSIVWINDDPKIKTNCDICNKEIIKDFDTSPGRHWEMTPEEHKERMEKARLGLL